MVRRLRSAAPVDRARAQRPSAVAVPAQRDERPADWTLLGELLVQRDLVSQGQLAEVLLQQASSGKRLGALLVEVGALDDRNLAATLAQQFNLPLVDLQTEAPDTEAADLLPESVARSRTAVAVGDDGAGGIVVAVADPHPEIRAEITELVNAPVSFAVASASDIRRSIDRIYRALSGIGDLVDQFSTAEATRSTVAVKAADSSTDAPVVQVVNRLVTQALRDRSSDVHIEPQEDRIRIRFRIDGALHDVVALPANMGPALVSRLKILAGMNIVERRRPQDGQIAMDVDGRAVDIRVATTETIWGEKVVLRLLDKSRPLYALNDLGMPTETHATFAQLVRSPFGMVLCAGPTGSGKTTTLYATLGEINEPHRNIMTIEDPVEYVFPSINQIQMNEQTGLSFATGLKSILRQDPDVILVGEIRDVETARIATQSALTGHFVLSSLHATDAVAALHRFLDMGIESFLIASSVVAVVGQRLVRRSCTSCRTPYKPTSDELAFFHETSASTKRTFYRGEGCRYCADTGYMDRIGVYELLRITPEIKRLIVGWATQDELRRMAVSQGMRTLREEAVALVERDVTTITEVLRTVYTS
ncbi:MAG: GspE/PulE family protein [Actinomycetes bacterium]